MAGFIIEFDHDSTDCFEKQYDFITKAGIQESMIGLLVAMPKTPLYERLKKEGRLSTLADVSDMTRPYTNVIPKGMAYDDMVDGYIALYQRLLSDSEIATRVRNKLRHFSNPVYQGGYSARDSRGIVLRLIWKGILPGGIRRIWYFMRSIPIMRPRALPTVIADWISALSMRDFAQRRLIRPNN